MANQKIKLSDYVISFLENKGVEDVFLVSGGGIIHLLDSLGQSTKIKYYCCLHEQAVAMAAEAYARVKQGIGVSLVTTGPGGTNAITGVAGSWMDSVPHLIISGQTFLKQTIGDSGVRQMGIQEINIIDLIKPITKYGIMVEDPDKIKYHLQKAFYLALTGRPGPVWLDIPADIQMTMIDESDLTEFNPGEIDLGLDSQDDIKKKVSLVVNLLKNSRNPIILVGQGIKISKSVEEFMSFVEKYKIPFLTARNANDIVDSSHELFVGRPGMWGTRAANFAVQNSDLFITIGSRLSLPQIGYDYEDFARNAKKVIVDIDKTEIEKYTVCSDLSVNCDAREFIKELRNQIDNSFLNTKDWVKQCSEWKGKYPVVLPEYKEVQDGINIYYFIDILSNVLDDDYVIVTDMGLSFQCTHQAFKVKKGQKLFTSSGLASMGYGLPAAVGACVASEKKKIVCISGDGGLQMNIQELQTLMQYKLPVKLFVLSNQGYLTIKQTQDLNFDGRHVACDALSGLSFPDLMKIADAYGIKKERFKSQEGLQEKVEELMDYDGPVVCEISVCEDQDQAPMVKPLKRKDGTFEKKAFEDMYPYLERDEFKRNMIFEDGKK